MLELALIICQLYALIIIRVVFRLILYTYIDSRPIGNPSGIYLMRVGMC